MERTNARYVEGLPEPVDMVTVDASFISLRVLLPVIRTWFANQPGEVVALIKPQFEAGRAEVSRGEGVIQDPGIHRRVLAEVLSFAEGQGFGIAGLVRSPLKGPKGNVEFLVRLVLPPPPAPAREALDVLIDSALGTAARSEEENSTGEQF
jgi:23S rRNA (cytidine1920-2'-O)/16S rRNA (cytidine1409-2'-O)-methyltransferase